MRVKKRDLLAIAVGVGVIVVLILSTGAKKAKEIPVDGRHRSFYDALKRGDSRAEVERGCTACHKALSGKHPPKEQCLICHRFHTDRR